MLFFAKPDKKMEESPTPIFFRIRNNQMEKTKPVGWLWMTGSALKDTRRLAIERSSKSNNTSNLREWGKFEKREGTTESLENQSLGSRVTTGTTQHCHHGAKMYPAVLVADRNQDFRSCLTNQTHRHYRTAARPRPGNSNRGKKGREGVREKRGTQIQK